MDALLGSPASDGDGRSGGWEQQWGDTRDEVDGRVRHEVLRGRTRTVGELRDVARLNVTDERAEGASNLGDCHREATLGSHIAGNQQSWMARANVQQMRPSHAPVTESIVSLESARSETKRRRSKSILAPDAVAQNTMFFELVRETHCFMPAIARAPAGSRTHRVSMKPSLMAAQISSVETVTMSSTNS